jgi:hypothetical protein
MTTRLAASATEVRNKVRDELSRLTLRSSLRNPHPPRRNLKRCNRVTPEARTLPVEIRREALVLESVTFNSWSIEL